MTGIGRRGTLRSSVAIVVGAAGIQQANAQGTRGSQDESAMEIQRVETVEPRPDVPILRDIPRISFATVHGNIVYLSGITAHPLHLGDVKDQTRQILQRIDQLLATCGTNKSRILTAQ